MTQTQCTELFQRLAAANPQPTTELCYSTPFELLIAVMLSAQSTDKRVNLVTAQLFVLANTPQAILALGEAGLVAAIRSIGLFNSKARHILATCAQLINQHHGAVPRTRAALEALPGVGRKTANVLLNTLFNEPTIAVDTHIFRVANRTGLTMGTTPLAVEQQLLKVVPTVFLQSAHHWLILHGRYICTARRPQCNKCMIVDVCEWPDKSHFLNKILIKNGAV